MYEPAISNRVSIARDQASMRIEVRAQWGLVGLGINIVFLFLWTSAGSGLWSPTFSNEENTFASVLGYTFYVGLWAAVEVMMFSLIAWMLFGREILAMKSDVVTKRIAFAMFGRNSDYDPRLLRNVRKREIPDPASRKYSGGQRILARFPLGERGDVAFDYGERTVYFGYYLEPAEADLIVDTIVEKSRRKREGDGMRRILPVLTVVAAIIVVWYIATVFMNASVQRDMDKRAGETSTTWELVEKTMSQAKPTLPAPHQIAVNFFENTFQRKITSRRSLVYHSWVTLASTLAGFGFGTVLGILIAVGIVHLKSLERSLMPWIIASQTVPILAIAPMVIVVLGAINITGLVPKALISTYLSFFPVTVGMVKGLRSPEAMHLDLMRTYNSSLGQTFWKLRVPASVPYLFTSMKIGIAASLVGAIVGELPTGAVAGIGSKLLAGSYYSQTIDMWAALVAGSILAALLVFSVDIVSRVVNRAMGGRPA